MTRALASLASARVMLAGFALLAAGTFAAHDDPAASASLIVAPLCLLAANLGAAIVTNRRLRRGGLGVFHVALLTLMIVAAVGRLCRFEGRVELTQGQSLREAAVEVTTRGPLHPDGLSAVTFVQGPFSVDYAPGVRRAHTYSEVGVVDGDGGLATRTVGDDMPLVLGGYRFYTTHNKGLAPIVTWLPDRGTPQTGSLHMPSYPLFDWKQENRFTPPGGPEVRVFLRVDRPLDELAAWRLDPQTTPTALIVHAEGRRSELVPGGSVRLTAGNLRFERSTGWMGYRIFFDPTLPWLFVLATVAATGLAWHLWRRAVAGPLPARRRRMEEFPA
jgi:cytochrome c biogenesis protein